MKKQELIHLHGLLAEVVDWCETTDGISVDVETYEQLDTRPASIHRSKTDHRDAVFTLTQAMAGELQAEEATTISASAD